MIGLIWFGHCYAHHQELTTIALITTWAVRFLGCCWLEVRCRLDKCALNFQPAQEPDGPCGNQHYSRELLIMGTAMPETC